MALREILAHFGFTFDKAALHEAGVAINAVKGHAHGAGASLTHLAEGLKGAFAAFIGGEIAHITHEIAEQGAELQDLSLQTGLSTNELQAWTLEAQLSGASAQDFTTGLRKLSRELATGVDESGQQSKLFKQLHISAKNAEGGTRDLADVLPEIAEKFKSLTNGAQKSALAQQLFGRAGTRLVPLLSKGAEGIEELHKQFEELGGGFSPEAVKRSKEYEDSLIKLQFSFFSFKSLLATAVFPALSDIIGGITKASVGASKWLKETTGLGNGIKILAGLLTGKLLLALAPFLLPGLKFLAIFLAVDDLIAFLEGKDSVIGDILNSWFGDGTADVVRSYANSAKAAIVGTFIGALDLLKIAFSSTSEESNKLWEHFELATRPVEKILDAIVDKLKLIKDAFTDFDTLTQGANDLLDLATSPFSTDEEKAQQRKNREARRIKGAGLDPSIVDYRPAPGAAPDPAHAALANAYDNIANGVGGIRPSGGAAQGFGPPAAPMAQLPIGPAPATYISPVTVTQTFGPGTGPEVKKLAKEAAREGVKQGLSDYRAALQSLEQRAP